MSYSRAVVLVVVLAALAGCGGVHANSSKEPPAPPMPVPAITVKASEWPDTYEALGTVRAKTATSIASRVAAYVLDVRVQTGDRVAAGQVLVTLDARDLDAALRQARSGVAEAQSAVPEADEAIGSAQAQLELARTTLRRMQELLDKRSLSRQEYDEVAARVKVAEAARGMAEAKKRQLASRIAQGEQAVEQARVVRGYAEIRAPFTGRITARRTEPGALASPAAPLFDIEREDAYRLEVSVEESRLRMVKAGEAVAVRLDAVDEPLSGRVGEIVPAVDPASRAFLVKIDLSQNPALRSGLFGRARFHAGSRQAVAIPRDAVIAQGQVQYVMVAESGYVRSRLVTVAEDRDGAVEVLSGLREGDQLVHPIPTGLRDGARIDVRSIEARK